MKLYNQNKSFSIFTIMILFLSVFVALVQMPIARAATSIDTIGDALNGASALVGQVEIFSITATASGTLSSIGLNLKSAAGNIRVAIWDVSGNLLGESSSTTAVVGWNDLAITGVSIVNGTPYRLGYQQDNSSTTVYYEWAPGEESYISQSYGAFPNPLGSPTVGNFIRNMRMTYNTASATIIFTSSPTGTGFITVNGTAQTTPYTIASATLGDHYTIAANSPVKITWGNQYVFSSWSDSGAQSHTYTVSVAATVTASFTQKLLTLDGVPANLIVSVNGVSISQIQSIDGIPK